MLFLFLLLLFSPGSVVDEVSIRYIFLAVLDFTGCHVELCLIEGVE